MIELQKITSYITFKKIFLTQFGELKNRDNLLKNFIEQISYENEVFVIGGYLRSIINNEPPKDIDIILNAHSSKIKSIIHTLNIEYSINRLGGFKLVFKKIIVDIWSIEDNWAFKKKVVKHNSKYSLSKIVEGAFFNYDALAIELNSLRCNFKYYNCCADQKLLDIVKKNSKYKKLSLAKEAIILRAFYLKKKYSLDFSLQLIQYLQENIDYIDILDGNIEDRMSTTLKKYSKYIDYLSEKDFVTFRNKLTHNYTSTNKQPETTQISIFE